MKQISYYPIYANLTDNELFPKDRLEQDGLYTTLKRVLLENGYNIVAISGKELQDADVYILNRLRDLFPLLYQMLKQRRMSQVIYQQWESALIDTLHQRRFIRHWAGLFGGILTWDDDLVRKGQPFNKSCYMVPCYDEDLRWSIPFKKRKFLTNISGYKNASSIDGLTELYSWRERFIRFMEKEHSEEFDLYGRGWLREQFPSYRGEVDNKLAVLAQYRFCLCFENLTHSNGYITEKIFDCMGAGTIPIYWGADNIFEYVPKTCLIDFRDFDSFELLYQFLCTMTSDAFDGYLREQQAYFKSAAYQTRFTYHAYAENVLAAIHQIEIKPHYSYLKAWWHLGAAFIMIFAPIGYKHTCGRLYNWMKSKYRGKVTQQK